MSVENVPTLRFEHLSDADKRAYILADNRIGEKAGWDREILAIELQAFVARNFDDIAVAGFEMPEVELILDEALEIDQPPLSPEDNVPQVPGLPVVQLGDTWILGSHRVHCGTAGRLQSGICIQ